MSFVLEVSTGGEGQGQEFLAQHTEGEDHEALFYMLQSFHQDPTSLFAPSTFMYRFSVQLI